MWARAHGSSRNTCRAKPSGFGFALTTFVFGWNMISWAYPQFPRFPTAYARWTFFSPDYPPALFFLSTVVICFSYFASLEILFSIWFFDLLFIVEGGILNRLGVRAISPLLRHRALLLADIGRLLQSRPLGRVGRPSAFCRCLPKSPAPRKIHPGRQQRAALLPGGAHRPDRGLPLHRRLAEPRGHGTQNDRPAHPVHAPCVHHRGENPGPIRG